MAFDMNIVYFQIEKAYKVLLDGGYEDYFAYWKLDDFKSFFHMFYSKYVECFHKAPTRLTTKQFIELLQMIPTDSNGADYYIEDYEDLIDRYFESGFFGNDYPCNYSVYHFLSGDIRYFKYLESIGGNYDCERGYY